MNSHYGLQTANKSIHKLVRALARDDRYFRIFHSNWLASEGFGGLLWWENEARILVLQTFLVNASTMRWCWLCWNVHCRWPRYCRYNGPLHPHGWLLCNGGISRQSRHRNQVLQFNTFGQSKQLFRTLMASVETYFSIRFAFIFSICSQLMFLALLR